MKQFIERLEGVQRIIVRCHSDLWLEGCDGVEMSGRIPGRESIQISHDGDALKVVCISDLWLKVPKDFPVEVEKVGGDASIRGINSPLNIGKIGGDLKASQMRSATIGQVGGDASIQAVREELNIAMIGGDLLIDGFSGNSAIGKVGGDMDVQNANGGFTAVAGGDSNVHVGELHGQEITIRSGGNLDLFLPENGGAQVEVSSGGHDITVELISRKEDIDAKFTSLLIGDGSARILVQAGGDVLVTDHGWDATEFTEDFEDFLKDWDDDAPLSSADAIISGLDLGKIEKAAQNAANHAEEAMRRANERIQSALKRMETSSGFSAPIPPVPPAPPVYDPFITSGVIDEEPVASRSVSNDEKALILQMLQDKKISVDDAEKLFEALESHEE